MENVMKNLNIRMSPGLHERLKKAAAQDNRSLNGEIISLLGDALAARSSGYSYTAESFVPVMYCTHGGRIHDASCFIPPKGEL
jgi:hypothetical protein